MTASSPTSGDELGRDLADDELAGAVEDEPERTLVAVLADEHDRPGEVRIGERRAGDEQLSAERIDLRVCTRLRGVPTWPSGQPCL